MSEPAGWEPARRALDAALRHDDTQLWIEADEMDEVDLASAFLAADRMTRALEQVLNAKHQRWLATRTTPPATTET